MGGPHQAIRLPSTSLASQNFRTTRYRLVHTTKCAINQCTISGYAYSVQQYRVITAEASGKDSPDPATHGSSDNIGTKQEELACYGIGSEVECVSKDNYGDRVQDQISTSGRFAATLPESSLLDILLLISPFFFWGTSMVAMKQLAPHTTPIFVAAWRLIPAGLALLFWAAVSGRRGPQSAIGWVAVSIFGLVDGACFQGFLAEGLQRTSAGLGSVIIDSQPLSVAVLASFLYGETLGLKGIAGLALGVSGLLLLEVPASILESLPESLFGTAEDFASNAVAYVVGTAGAAQSSIWDSGEWWMLLAAQSMAVGTVMVRWVAKYCDPVAATGWHMILGGIPLLVLAWNQERAEMLEHASQLNGADAGLLLYVSLLGSAASYGVFFYEATARGNLTALSSLTFLTPMFAAAGGFLALGETLSPLQLIGAGVTLAGVALISGDSASGKPPE